MKVKNRPIVNEVLGGEEALQKKLKQLEKENEVLRCKLSSVSHTHLTRLFSHEGGSTFGKHEHYFYVILSCVSQSESSLTVEMRKEVVCGGGCTYFQFQ